jgi:hypothetical protein
VPLWLGGSKFKLTHYRKVRETVSPETKGPEGWNCPLNTFGLPDFPDFRTFFAESKKISILQLNKLGYHGYR